MRLFRIRYCIKTYFSRSHTDIERIKAGPEKKNLMHDIPMEDRFIHLAEINWGKFFHKVGVFFKCYCLMHWWKDIQGTAFSTAFAGEFFSNLDFASSGILLYGNTSIKPSQ